MSLYRTTGALGALVGLNIAAKLFSLPIVGNFLFANYLTEALMVVGIVGLLADINIIKTKDNGFLKLGVYALIAGVLWEILSFSSLLFREQSQLIFTEWMSIAPIIIFAIGVPVLYISRQVSREKLIFGMDSTGIKGILFNMLFTSAYTIGAIFILIKLGVI